MLQRLRQDREVRNSESGFTLIELLIVIVVLGVLAGIVVFGVGKFKSDSEAAACKEDVHQVQTAASAYNAAPSTFNTWPTLAQLVTGGYIATTPPASEGIAIDAAGKVTGTC